MQGQDEEWEGEYGEKDLKRSCWGYFGHLRGEFRGFFWVERTLGSAGGRYFIT